MGWRDRLQHPLYRLLPQYCGYWRSRWPCSHLRFPCGLARNCRLVRARLSASHECCARVLPWQLVAISVRFKIITFGKFVFRRCACVRWCGGLFVGAALKFPRGNQYCTLRDAIGRCSSPIIYASVLSLLQILRVSGKLKKLCSLLLKISVAVLWDYIKPTTLTTFCRQ